LAVTETLRYGRQKRRQPAASRECQKLRRPAAVFHCVRNARRPTKSIQACSVREMRVYPRRLRDTSPPSCGQRRELNPLPMTRRNTKTQHRHRAETETSAARSAERGEGARVPKMRFIHPRRKLEKGEIIQLDCDTQCNFMLLTDADYAAYQQIRRFSYYGGTFKHFPARITVPQTGDWNIIIDLAGATREIQYNITIILD
jgi:hypothetical protein